ncbi:MAG: NFACT family protein [Polyangia bacterium]
MTLRAVELDAVCKEVQAQLAGQPVQKVVQPDDETLRIRFGGGHWLVLNASSRGGRLHLSPEKLAGTGDAAPSFCMLARKYLVGARLLSIRAVEGERACEIELVTPEDTPRLRLFLFGPAAQLQLVARPEDETLARVLGAVGPARRLYEALPEPHPIGAQQQEDRFATGPGTRSERIATEFETLAQARAIEAARTKARTRLGADLKKVQRLLVRLGEDLARADAAEARRKHGDLILAHLHEIPRGASEVTLPDDFTDGSPLVIPLDPARSAKANAERLYKEQKRLVRARAATRKRLAEVQAKADTLVAALAAVEEQSDSALLAEARVQPAPRRNEPARALPYKAFTSRTGAPIYVGRGAAKNDELTFKIARGNDLWLHTRDVPGAHVIVPLSGRDVDAETLVDAATLAAHHSNAREEQQVDVGYALRKHLRKPKGAAPGAVLVSQQKTIRVRMEPVRLARLLASGRT